MTVTVYQKLANVRAEMVNIKLNKSGFNKYSGFGYFELKDFLPETNKLMAKHGLLPIFNLYDSLAVLKIIDAETGEEIIFRTPITELSNKNKMEGVQKIGSQHTYFKRYLYFNALELAESDIVDSLEQVAKEKASYSDVSKIKELYGDRVNGMLKHYGINDLSELDKDEATRLINIMEKEVIKQQDPLEDIKEEKQVSINDL